jgi:2-polyprenyl-6-methoxyphenol hydroxylase-like FAD-dependent oxidoreductase
MSSDERHDAIVVGAGPVGAICALALARKGISVALIEAEPQINRNPRAATTHPATLEMMADLDLLDGIKTQGLVARYFQFWDRLTGRKVAEFDHELLKHDTRFPFVLQCEQHKIANLALTRLRTMPNVILKLGSELTGFGQDASGTTAQLDSRHGREILHGRYLIGCDGGRSRIRKDLKIEFEGYTHPERFVVLTTRFDFSAEGFCFRNYLSGPGEWANLFKVTGDDGAGYWRAVFPTRIGETDEQALSEQPVQERLNGICRQARPYQIVHRNIYSVHQRVASCFRGGRVLLAGDAAHVNNPIGGLGMNFGIHDAVELAERLQRVIQLGSDQDDELDGYDRIRRSLNVEYVQAQTVQNKKRLEEKNPEARARYFRELEHIERDPQRQREFLLRTSLLDSVKQARVTLRRAP